MEDIQSWWEVPSIAYFCSLFRTAFNLLDFDIEELEEALLTDGTEESASSLLTELIVRLLNGCLGNNDISAFNYQMYLRRLFRRKCQETGRYNPFNTDIDFQFLPLRTKVEILYALCDFRLDADDVLDLFKNLEAESLRVEPLGWDVNHSAYWYFYGTRLYREDIIRKGKNKKKKSKKRGWFYGDDWLDDEDTERVWQVVCFTEEDWSHLTEKFSKATSKVEKELYRSLSQNFLPEIPRLFQEKERLQRKRLLELAPRRTSSRVLQKIKQKEEENKPSDGDSKDQDSDKGRSEGARETRAKRRDLLRTKSESSGSSEDEDGPEKAESSSSDREMPQKATKKAKGPDKKSKNSAATNKGEPPPEPPVKTGRKTNNSLACATGQILIPDTEEPVNSTRKKLKTSQIFSQTEEDIQTDMYKVLEQLTAHEDAWPFMDPVEEEYAPNYYAVIRRPMDLRKMEERLDTGFYTDFSMFKADFKLIVNNCRLYNGQDNEYTMMVDNLQAAFDRLTEKYMHRLSSSDEEIAVEYQIPTPSRKHKLKPSESPTNHKKKKRKSHSDTGEEKSNSHTKEDRHAESSSKEVKESHHKSKDGKLKKQRKGHHRHGKHSKNHKKEHHKSEHGSKNSKHSKKQRHGKGKGKGKDGKKSKQRRKKSKHSHSGAVSAQRAASPESAESSHRSRSASPLPSIHTPSPSPTPPPSPGPEPPDFYKDKFDKIKERRRGAAPQPPHAWDSLFDAKKNPDKHKQSLPFPGKDKNRKLRETIEKLKAKNEKYKDSSPFNNLFADKGTDRSTSKESSKQDRDDPDFTDDELPETREKPAKGTKKSNKKTTTARNESASEALEQAVKDISKWLEDAPRGSAGSSPCDSPAHTASTEETEERLDDEFAQDKPLLARRDLSRKRPSSREPKALKRREIQRTIDRLQPGKSKGNLLTNISSKHVEKVEEVAPSGPLNKARDSSKPDEDSPKLSLGSVLPTVEFTLGKDHNFADDEPAPVEKAVASDAAPEADAEKSETPVEEKPSVEAVETKQDVPKVEVEEPITKPSQEKATPNLSAWFKAFGAPKSTPTITTAPVKKKLEEVEPEKKNTVEKEAPKEEKVCSPKPAAKYDSPPEPATPNPEGGEAEHGAGTPRARRTSTASSVSERSSFSQDLDSPRHQLAHTSPLLRSPASPRTDDFQKITYPIINGTVRAGFYQDTTSIKSSPEKSCSPREGPQSPYSPYSQHVYASNNSAGSATPSYLPTYGQSQPPPYYDGARATPAAVKPRVHDDYTALGPDSYPHAPAAPLAPPASKNTLFPVKKRTYNESDTAFPPKMGADPKETQNKHEYQKMVASMQTMSGIPTASVDDIAAALGEKSELGKLGALRDKPPEYLERRPEVEPALAAKKDALDPNKPIGMTKNDNVDMVNMGYMNPEMERRLTADANEYSAPQRDTKQSKGYEIDAIAMNLGLGCGAIKGAPKPAHSQERSAADLALNHHLMQQEYEALGATTGFTLTDIELANKKLYSAAAPHAVVDYGNWKMNQRKHDLPADYAAPYDKLRTAPAAHQDVNVTNSAALNYNKNLQQHQQYNTFNVPRSNLQNLPSELRIPNPRGLLKNEHMNVVSSLSSNEMISKNTDTIVKTQKAEKHSAPVSHSSSALQYKTPYSTHSALPLDSLRNLPNIPQMLERYSNDERYLSTFTGGASLYHDKTFQMAHMTQMFNKSLASEHPASTASGTIYTQPSVTITKDTNIYKNSPNLHNIQAEPKAKAKRKRVATTSQSYHASASNEVLPGVKSSMVPGSAFNFGAANMPLAAGLYPDNGGFSIEDFRNSTNQLMAANYMAAVAHQRSNAATEGDKHAKVAHQGGAGAAFGFIGAGARAAPPYAFAGEASSPLYQQYLQRHQEELLRQTGAQIMGLYPPGYPARPPYDAINRPSWL